MITNRTQYATAKRLLRELNTERRLLEPGVLFNPRNLPRAQRLEEVRRIIPELESETEQYRNLTEGKCRVDLSVIEKIPELLVMGRVRAGLTQDQLSKLVGMKRQQLCRYESEKFQSASLKTIQRIAEALTTVMENRWANVHRINSCDRGVSVAPDVVSGVDAV
jgi:Helix-turn-helix.